MWAGGCAEAEGKGHVVAPDGVFKDFVAGEFTETGHGYLTGDGFQVSLMPALRCLVEASQSLVEHASTGEFCVYAVFLMRWQDTASNSSTVDLPLPLLALSLLRDAGDGGEEKERAEF